MKCQLTAFGAVLAPVLLALSACGGGDEPAKTPAAPAKPAEMQKPAAAAPKPQEPAAPGGAASSAKVDMAQVKLLFGSEPSSPKVRNRLKKEKVALGKKLYHETKLSRNADISCATCHALDTYGQDNKVTSPGTGGAAGKRNTPTTFNAYRQFAQFWDYRAKTVEEQALMPILTANEHGLADEAEIVKILGDDPDYVAAFAEVFPKDDPAITAENVGLALGAFERKLETRSRFDDFVDGDASKLTDAEKRGLNAFMSVGCTTCHATRLLGGHIPQKLGLIMPIDTPDKGRFEFTGNEGEKNMWKVSHLLNVAETAPYLHDGSIATLEEVTTYMAKFQLGRDLSKDQVDDIVAFMKALTGPPPAIAKSED